LHEAGYDVALVDADLALPNLAEVLGEPNESGIHSVLAGEAAVDDVLRTVEDGPDLVGGGQTIEHFEQADPANLRAVIDPLDDEYDVVLVDTGAGLSHEALVATGLADGTVLVTTPAEESVDNVAKTAEFVDHAEATILGAVVTRTTADTDLGDIAERLGVPSSAQSRRTPPSTWRPRRAVRRATPTARFRVDTRDVLRRLRRR